MLHPALAGITKQEKDAIIAILQQINPLAFIDASDNDTRKHMKDGEQARMFSCNNVSSNSDFFKPRGAASTSIFDVSAEEKNLLLAATDANYQTHQQKGEAARDARILKVAMIRAEYQARPQIGAAQLAKHPAVEKAADECPVITGDTDIDCSAATTTSVTVDCASTEGGDAFQTRRAAEDMTELHVPSAKHPAIEKAPDECPVITGNTDIDCSAAANQLSEIAAKGINAESKKIDGKAIFDQSKSDVLDQIIEIDKETKHSEDIAAVWESISIQYKYQIGNKLEELLADCKTFGCVAISIPHGCIYRFTNKPERAVDHIEDLLAIIVCFFEESSTNHLSIRRIHLKDWQNIQNIFDLFLKMIMRMNKNSSYYMLDENISGTDYNVPNLCSVKYVREVISKLGIFFVSRQALLNQCEQCKAAIKFQKPKKKNGRVFLIGCSNGCP
jgi:hypothetical protein